MTASMSSRAYIRSMTADAESRAKKRVESMLSMRIEGWLRSGLLARYRDVSWR
jgi:hypothetical protein